jgi:hypothetical protein
MSMAMFSVGEAAIAAQGGQQPATVRKPPPKRQVVAVPDTTQTPEPR